MYTQEEINSGKAERRLGQFQIPLKTIRDTPMSLLPIFSKMVVIRCEFLFHKDAFHYLALSPLFDDISDWSKPPYYEVGMSNDEPWAQRTNDNYCPIIIK